MKLKLLLLLLYGCIAVSANEVNVISVAELKEYCANPLNTVVSWSQIIVCVTTLVGIIIAIVCHCHVIRKNTKTIVANHDLTKKLASIDAMKDAVDKIEYLCMRDEYFKYYNDKKPVPLEELNAKSPQTRKYLNVLEGLAIGVKKNIYDEATIKDGFCSIICLSAIVFKEYIDERQNNTHHKKCFEILTWLAERWRQDKDEISQDAPSHSKL